MDAELFSEKTRKTRLRGHIKKGLFQITPQNYKISLSKKTLAFIYIVLLLYFVIMKKYIQELNTKYIVQLKKLSFY